ncbi:NAD(P)-dependent oxidoreductase [Chryseobacterium limigenitum]|uniref:3-hydroxyisobutyrate dehydrogenase n=1 Tax=Chryseobacterium limigenitum TaxID=1612149 RepID=A0A1K2IL44_9FLAO|nr:NAD(P)-dependent oxidoreductase [Chryseobacterium limigenitum]SFZ92936.1 3-hydroxyisobutyrate dehydrogenase [Chryseobacterium limigenitum]
MQTQPVIALLSPGDMGTQIAKALIKSNFKVITSGEGRSEKTLQNIKDAGIEDAGSLQNTVEQAHVILSLTSPEGSIKLAENIISCLKNTSNRPIYIDLNSNTPTMALSIEELLLSANIKFVNGAVMGASKDIPENGVLVVSGMHRNLFLDLFGKVFKIKDAGEKTEAASAYKLLFSMVNKGINALFFETMTAAAHFGILDELNESLQDFLPGTYQDLIKTTPTYPRHILRRIDEMNGLTKMLKSENLPNIIASGTAETFERVYQSNIFENEKPKGVIETFRNFKKLI